MKHLRKSIILALAAVLLALSGPSFAQSEPTVITMWNIATEGDPFRPVLQGAIDQFNAAHTDVHFDVRSIGNETFKQQLQNAIAGGQPPDVFQTWGGGQLKALADAGIVRAIPELDGEADGRFIPNALATSTFDGAHYAVPANLAGIFLWYNQGLFTQHGVELPTTWDKLITACQQFRSKGITPIAMGNRDEWPGGFWMGYLVMRLQGTETFANAASGTNGAGFSDPVFVQAGQRIQDAVNAGCFQDGFNDADIDSAQNLFGTGAAAMQLQGDWLLGSLRGMDQNFVTNNVRILPFPEVSGGSGLATDMLGGTGQSFAIAADAPPETANALIELLTSDSFGRAAVDAGFIPALAGYDQSISDPLVATMAQMLTNASYVQLYYDQYLPPTLARAHLSTTHQLFGLTTTPEQAAQAMAAASQQQTAMTALTGVPMREAADARGFLLGTAVTSNLLRDNPQYADIVSREFNMLTPETEMKMGPLRPNRDTFAFNGADEIVAFAEAHDMAVRGHTLVWHEQLPGWLENGNFSRDELLDILHEHISTVVGHYRGRIAAWDVVNEALDEDGSMRDNLWMRVIGPEYIDLAFQWAHEADPDALLFYNDYDTEGMDAKSNAAFALVSGLVERGVPINGVGLQTHISIGEPPRMEDIAANINRIGALGLQVEITEMDVKIQNSSGSESERFDAQAQLYANVARTCLASEACTALTTWGFGDQYSWIPSRTGNADAPLLYDTNLQPKPAYFALLSALASP
jgi:endo-1,4-beta-xylanase